MGAVQSTYASRLSAGHVGEIADLGESNVISRDVETAGGIGWGLAVIQGTADNQCELGAAGAFLGITVRDIAVDATRGDKYAQYDCAAIINEGVIWVTAGEAVVAGDAVYRTAAGALNKTAAGNTLIANARWETSAALGALAQIRLW